MQRAKCKTKLKNQNQKLKIFLNFDLGFILCVLLFALFYYVLRVTYYGLLILNFTFFCLLNYFYASHSLIRVYSFPIRVNSRISII